MTRTRDKSTIAYVDYIEEARDGDQVATIHGTYANPVESLRRMTDVSTPRFRKRSEQGEIIISPMERIVTDTVVVPVNYWKARTRFRWSRDIFVNGYDFVPWVEPELRAEIERLEALAITDAYADVGKPDVATLTELAEIRETLGFLWSPVRKMIDLTKRLRSHLRRIERLQANYAKRLARWESLPAHVKKKRPKPAPPVLPKLRLGKFEASDIPSAWLAYRYAIMPLVYTFQDIQEHLARSEFPTRATARGKQKMEVDLAFTGEWARYPYYNGDTRERTRRTGSLSVKVRAGVLYQPDWRLSTLLGFQLNQVPMALYEAIPLSFVTDWFHNGAAVYNALTAEARAVKIHGAWVTSTVEFHAEHYLDAQAADDLTTCSGGGLCTIKTGKWTRRRLANLSDVRLLLRVELNGKRIADGLSLIWSMLATASKHKG